MEIEAAEPGGTTSAATELTMILMDILEIVDSPSNKMDILKEKAVFLRNSLLSLRDNYTKQKVPLLPESEEQKQKLQGKTELLQRWREELSNLM